MYRVLTLADLALVCALGFAVYKTFELGPYGAALLFGRCIHVFVVAVQGYI